MNKRTPGRKMLLACLLIVVLQDGLSRYQIVSDYGWWKIVLLVLSTLPLLILVWGGFWALIDYFRRKSESVLAATFGGILFFPMMFVATSAVLLVKAGSYLNYSYERHAQSSERYAQEILMPNGRVYSWVMGTTFFGFPGVCGFYERPLISGFYFRECLCFKDHRGIFELKRVSENSVACVIDGHSDVHEL